MIPGRPCVVALAVLAVLAVTPVAGCGGDGVSRAPTTASTTSAGSAPPASPPIEPATTSTAPVTTVAPEDVPAAESPDGLGDDPGLDRLAEQCAARQFASCDTLFFTSPPDSDYEAYGDSCGGRNEPGPLCVDLYGRGTGPDE